MAIRDHRNRTEERKKKKSATAAVSKKKAVKSSSKSVSRKRKDNEVVEKDTRKVKTKDQPSPTEVKKKKRLSITKEKSYHGQLLGKQLEKKQKSPRDDMQTKKKKKPKISNSAYFLTLWNNFLHKNSSDVTPLELYEEAVSYRRPSEHSDENEYLAMKLPSWSKWIEESSLKNGAPFLLLLCSSASRAVQLNRKLLPFKSSTCISAKLFSKHMKAKVQSDFLSSRIVHWGFGTPMRIAMLAKERSLSLENLRAVVIDYNYRDAKNRRICDMPETRRDTFDFLTEHVLSSAGTVKLILL